jgi:hypothetical protein
VDVVTGQRRNGEAAHQDPAVGNALLKKLMQTEPETILSSLTVDAGAILEVATDQLASLMRAEIYGDTAPLQPRNAICVASPNCAPVSLCHSCLLGTPASNWPPPMTLGKTFTNTCYR